MGEIVKINGIEISLELYSEVKKLIRRGHKLAAVKLVKDTKNWNLKESKDFVDDLPFTSMSFVTGAVGLLIFVSDNFIAAGEKWLYSKDNTYKTNDEIIELFYDSIEYM